MAKLAAIQDVNDVVAFKREPVTIDGTATVASAGDVNELAKVANIAVAKGSLADLSTDGGGGTIAVVDTGEGASTNVGGTVTVTDSRGKDVDLRVVAVLEATQDTAQTGSIIDITTFESLVGDVAPTLAFVDVASGAQGKTKDAIQNLADVRPDITAQEGNAVGKLIGTVFDFLIKAVTGLLLMSVVIALIGIINTMSLAILERRRELGLLRIIGMTDKRVRRMVTLESVLISLLGTLGGLALGLVSPAAAGLHQPRQPSRRHSIHPLDRADRHPRPGCALRRPGCPSARKTIHQARGTRRDLGHLTQEQHHPLRSAATRRIENPG